MCMCVLLSIVVVVVVVVVAMVVVESGIILLHVGRRVFLFKPKYIDKRIFSFYAKKKPNKAIHHITKDKPLFTARLVPISNVIGEPCRR